MVGDVAERHRPLAHPDPLPQLQEEAEGGGATVVRFAEVEDDVFDAGTIQKLNNLLGSRFDANRAKGVRAVAAGSCSWRSSVSLRVCWFRSLGLPLSMCGNVHHEHGDKVLAPA
jgi:hypothetical protein